MGNCWSRRNASSDANSRNLRNITVAVLGLDDAGKTVTAKVLKGDPPNEVVPTIGFTNIQFSFKKRQISMYDLGGGSRIRDIWRNYFGEVHGLIYVVDSSHRERIEECREVLVGVLEDKKVKGKPLLVLGNKQDIHGAMDTSEICDCLKLDALANTHQSLCRIECCSALRQEKGKVDNAIINGFQWLLDTIDINWVTLKARVDKDVADQKEQETKARMERAERVRKLREEREKEAAKNAENGESKVEDEDIHGDPFKPIDTIQFSRKVDASLKTQEIESTSKGATTHNSQADLVEVGNKSSVLISSLQEEQTNDEAEHIQSTCHLETGYPGNGVCGRTPQPLSLSPIEAVNLEQRKLTPATSNVLPPIELSAELSERKRRKRRNKRNRVVPLMPSISDDIESTESSALGRCLDSKSIPTDHLDRAAISTDNGCLADSVIDADKSKVASCLSSWESSTPRDGTTGNKLDDVCFAEDLPTENHSTSRATMFAQPNGDSEDVIS